MRHFFSIPCFILAAAALILAARPASASVHGESAMDHLKIIDKGRVKAVLGSNLIMLDDEKRYRLDNILVPAYEDAAALAALKTELLDKMVVVYANPAAAVAEGMTLRTDRYGVPFAHIVRYEDGLWMQRFLVSQGLAWAYTPTADDAILSALKHIEAKARRAKAGLWASGAHGIKSPQDIGQGDIGSYEIVQGRIVSVSGATKGFFLNFSTDWRNGFSVLLPENFQSWFADDKKLKQTLSAWRGRLVRVRGWVTYQHKPYIEVTEKGQMDVLP